MPLHLQAFSNSPILFLSVNRIIFSTKYDGFSIERKPSYFVLKIIFFIQSQFYFN